MAALSQSALADAVADSVAVGRDGNMSRAEIMDFIADCEEAGVDTSAFENMRAFVAAADGDGDGQVSRAELAAWLKANATRWRSWSGAASAIVVQTIPFASSPPCG